jgi:hypothetical protein
VARNKLQEKIKGAIEISQMDAEFIARCARFDGIRCDIDS